MTVYGLIQRTKDEILEDQKSHFEYLKALISAEQLNPEDDYDNEREISLLRKVAVSPCNENQRSQLVIMLGIVNDEE